MFSYELLIFLQPVLCFLNALYLITVSLIVCYIFVLAIYLGTTISVLAILSVSSCYFGSHLLLFCKSFFAFCQVGDFFYSLYSSNSDFKKEHVFSRGLALPTPFHESHVLHAIFSCWECLYRHSPTTQISALCGSPRSRMQGLRSRNSTGRRSATRGSMSRWSCQTKATLGAVSGKQDSRDIVMLHFPSFML